MINRWKTAIFWERKCYVLCISTNKQVLCMLFAKENHILGYFNIFYHHKRIL